MKLKKDLSNKLEVEKECAAKINKLLERYNCELIPMTIIVKGKIISKVEIGIKLKK